MEERTESNLKTEDSRRKTRIIKIVLLLLMAVTAGTLAYYGLQYLKAEKLYESVGESVKETTKEGAAVAAPSYSETDISETGEKVEDTEKKARTVGPLFEMETAPPEYECETNISAENAVYSDPYYGYERNPAPDVPNFGVDFERLRSINPNVVGWIYGCGGKIDYPVVLDTNEGFYLKHAIDGSRSSSGTIYVAYGHSGEMNQFVTPIFGHNMKNGSMFMPLLYYSGRGYWLSHPFFTFVMEDETRIYDIVSVIECAPDSLPGYEAGKGDEGRQEFIDYIKAASLYDTGIGISTDDKLLMLITCRDHSSRRQVVIGKLRNDEDEHDG